jgi:hypothetical protein
MGSYSQLFQNPYRKKKSFSTKTKKFFSAPRKTRRVILKKRGVLSMKGSDKYMNGFIKVALLEICLKELA